MNRISELTTQRNNVIANAQEILNRGLKTAEEKERYQQLLADSDHIQGEIDMLNNLDRRMSAAGLNAPRPVHATPAPVTAAPSVITQRDSVERRKFNDAARRFFRDGFGKLNAEQRTLLTTSDTVGGALVSQEFNTAFVEASKHFGPIFNMVNRKDADTGEPTKFVVTDGTNQTFSLLTEGTTSASSKAQQPTVFSDITDTDTLISSVIYSAQEAEDASDLNAFLTRIAGLAVSRARETAITLATTNDGTSTALPSSPTGGILASVQTGATTASLPAGIGYSDLISLAGSTDHSYYIKGAYMASQSVHDYMLGQKDGMGRPFYLVDPATGLLMVNGKPLYVNTAMPAYNAASSPVVLFGDFSKAWNVLSTGVGLKVIDNDESPALTLHTRELIIYTRIGQSVGLNNAVKALYTPAS